MARVVKPRGGRSAKPRRFCMLLLEGVDGESANAVIEAARAYADGPNTVSLAALQAAALALRS